MTLEEIQEVLDGLFYKPSWEFKMIKDWSDRPMLQIRAELLDSTTWPIDAEKFVTVVQVGYIPLDYVTSKEFVERWLISEIMRLEKHEQREWLRSKIDGKPIDDPHAHDRREA